MYVYLLENPAGTIYIGCATNLKGRINSHNLSQGPDWTQGKGPWKLIYSEVYPDKKSALIREKYLKSLKAGQRIKKILGIV